MQHADLGCVDFVFSSLTVALSPLCQWYICDIVSAVGCVEQVKNYSQLFWESIKQKPVLQHTNKQEDATGSYDSVFIAMFWQCLMYVVEKNPILDMLRSPVYNGNDFQLVSCLSRFSRLYRRIWLVCGLSVPGQGLPHPTAACLCVCIAVYVVLSSPSSSVVDVSAALTHSAYLRSLTLSNSSY